MNKAILMGRLTRNPEVRYQQGTNLAIANYCIAVDRKYNANGEKATDFINCVSFGKGAEFVEKYFAKGTKVAITGRIQTGSYQNKDGVTIPTFEIVVEEQEFAESKKSSEESSAPRGYGNVESRQETFMNIPDNIAEELPFN